MVRELARSPVIASARIGWVDTAKGLGIILVVVGHVLRGLVASSVIAMTPAVAYLDAWIYAFHMPLFFFLSGLFLARSAARPTIEFVRDKIGTIAYPYFVWSLITLSIKSPLGQLVNQPRTLSEVPEILYRPIEQFWFLYVLFLLSIFVGLALKSGIRPWGIVVIALLLYPGVWPLYWSGFAPFELCRSDAIYLGLGVTFGGYPPLHSFADAGKIKITLAVVAIVGLSTLTWFASLLEATHSHSLDLVLALNGTGGIVAVAVLVSRTKIDSAISFLGRYSLEIFVAHTIATAAIRILFQQYWHVGAAGPYIVLCTIVGLYGPIFLAVGLKRIGFRWVFTMPKKDGLENFQKNDGLRLP